MISQRPLLLTLAACGLLAACGTPTPNYTIKVTPTAQGIVAMPPACPAWSSENADPYDNQPEPQFGCADARNLAAQVENPEDLLDGREMGPARGVMSVGAIRRYDNNQPRLLILPGAETSSQAVTTAPNNNSPLSGDATGGGPGSAPSGPATGATSSGPVAAP